MAVALPLARLPTSRVAERCCSRVCDYRVPVVRYYLAIISQLRTAGQDPAEAMADAMCTRTPGWRGEFSGGSAQSRWATVVADIERAVQAAGPGATPEQVAAVLCPYSSEDLACPPVHA